MTRYYPSTKAPFAHPNAKLFGTWGVMGAGSPLSPVKERYVLQKIKELERPGDIDAQIKIYMTTNQQPNYDYAPDWTWITKPLQAQTISGTFNFCFLMAANWMSFVTPPPPGPNPPSTDVIARPKIHMYIADGNTLQHKANLVSNFVAFEEIPQGGQPQWLTMAFPLAFTPVAVSAGDRIVIEFGVRIISSGLSGSTQEWSRITLGFMNADQRFLDANPITDGTIQTRAPWMEFSDDILELDTVVLPTNDHCPTAINIPTLPYTSDFLDSTFSTDASHALWWRYTAERSGAIKFFLHGSNVSASVQIYTGICGFLSLANNGGVWMADDRSHSITYKPDAIVGTTYYIRIADDSQGFRGGRVRLSVIYPEAPKANDLILAANTIFVLREGAYVNVSNVLSPYTPTGIAVDYTGRPMKSLATNSFHTQPRILVGLHNLEMVIVLDAATLNEGESGIDWIGNGANWFHPDVNLHMGQLYITGPGRLYAGWFGDGYGFIGGKSLQDNISTSMLNGPASHPLWTAIKSIDATHGEHQDNAPFIHRNHIVATTLAAWAFTLDEATGILYYVTGGFYIPTGTHQTIKRFNVNTNTQLADFATIPPSGPLPGLKGLELLGDGGLLVCNGDRVHRVDAAGTVVGTYIPSLPDDATCLIDLALSVDKSVFWVVDLYSTRIFKFNVTTGLELMNFQPYGTSGSVVQLTIYNPPPVVPVPDLSGLHYVKNDARYDTYNTAQRKIPDPTIKTAFLGE